MDNCNGIITFALADLSHMSIFNNFVETDRDVFHSRIIDDFFYDYSRFYYS